MKKIIFLILIFASAFDSNAQSLKNLNNNINRILGQMDSAKNMNSGSKFDSLQEINNRLAQSIVEFADAAPDFIAQNIKDTAFVLNSFHNNLSDDRKVKIVSWDDESGGTLRNYNYIVFWNSAGKLNHKTFVSNIEGTDTSKIYYTSIDSIVHIKQNDENDLYFVMGGTLSRPYYNQQIFCYKINKAGEFTNDAPIFKVGNKMLSSIDVDCPSYFNDKESMHVYYTLMHFNNDKHTLYVPIFPDLENDDEKETERRDTLGSRKFHYFLYQFDGTNFVYKKK